jgi:hypothetical protein
LIGRIRDSYRLVIPPIVPRVDNPRAIVRGFHQLAIDPRTRQHLQGNSIYSRDAGISFCVTRMARF